MFTRKFASSAIATFAVLALSGGCALETAADATEASEADSLRASALKLPSGDPCRDVLAPLSLALADGAVGLSYTRAVTVSLESETDTRLYSVLIERAGRPIWYQVELDNDSASTCQINAVTSNEESTLDTQPRSRATSSERRFSAPIAVSPANDDCESTVRLLAQAVAASTVGVRYTQRVDVSLEGVADNRIYSVRVDGKAFRANGQTFANDYAYELNLSNDADLCFVQGVTQK